MDHSPTSRMNMEALVTSFFVDTHCHLNFSEFGKDVSWAIETAQKRGVKKIIVPSVSSETFAQVSQLGEEHAAVKTAYGIHPWFLLNELSLTSEKQFCEVIEPYLNSPAAVAVGETGLDAMIKESLDHQQLYLSWHLSIAREKSLPLILHSRKTHARLLAQLKSYKRTLSGVIHGFSGSYEEAMAFIKEGFFIGVGGVITYERAAKTRAAFARLPLDGLVLETDAPNAPLCGHQGQSNAPHFTADVAQALADLKGLSLETVAEQTTRNAEQLFSLS